MSSQQPDAALVPVIAWSWANKIGFRGRFDMQASVLCSQSAGMVFRFRREYVGNELSDPCPGKHELLDLEGQQHKNLGDDC